MIIDQLLGKFLSVFFRVIVVISGWLIFLTNDNFFSSYVYLTWTVLYIFIYFKTVLNEKFSQIRLLNDFALIGLFLFGKELSILSFVYCSLPIINAHNFSGEKKSYFLYLYHIIILLMLTHFKFSWLLTEVLIILLAINLINNIKSKYVVNIRKLNDKIDYFLEHEYHQNKTYRIYQGLIDVLNNSEIVLGLKPSISRIVCFKIVNNNIHLENSSDFIWKYYINREEIKSVMLLNETTFIIDSLALVLNEKNEDNNFFILQKLKNYTFLFIFTFNGNQSILTKLYTKKVSLLAISRIAKLMVIDEVIRVENKKMLNEFRNKYFQIQNADKAMHFIRNKLSILSNFIEMTKVHMENGLDEEDIRLYNTELTRLELSFSQLMDRVKTILEKSNKPYSAINVEPKSFKFVFAKVSEVWLDYFNDFNPNIEFEFEVYGNELVNVNKDGLIMLLDDWISNMFKHSIGGQKVIFRKNEDFLIIFQSEFKVSDREKVATLVNDFNSTERNRILNRTSHGIVFIKSILDEMCLKGEMMVDHKINNIILTLTFKQL